MQILINKKNKLLKKSAYVETDGFVFTGFPDASTGLFPDASDEEENMLFILSKYPPDDVVFPDASVAVEFPDASDEEENMLFILPKYPPDDVVFPDASVAVEFPDASDEEENMLPNIPDPDEFPDASVEEENGDERLNDS
jgi:hypothetical protein